MENQNPTSQTTPSPSFVHLHLHTMYSLLDGAIRLDDLFKKCKEYGMSSVAQTDHGNMFGSIDFYNKAKKYGVKPILGCEIYLTTGSRFDRATPFIKSEVVGGQDEQESKHHIHHLVLLCKDNEGYKNLCKIVSEAYQDGFYYKPRADFETLKKYSKGLIALTACLKGEVGYNFFTGEDQKAFRAIDKYRELFGDDLYLEIQENGLQEQAIANKKIVAYAREHKVNLVATNDCHYLDRTDAMAHEVLLSIQTGKTLQDEKRMKLSSDQFYLKTPEEMRKAFHYAPDACDNTVKIAQACNVDLKWVDEKGHQIYILPTYDIDTDETPAEYFARMSRIGLEERFNGPHFAKLRLQENFETEIKPKYSDRLEGELQMIIQMGFPGYFLIVSDFIKWAKQNGIPVGPGRGSGAGSLVAYALQITNIDPIPYNLLFERFINPERVSMPDFDVDFCQNRRGEVIDYVTKKYGSERVAQIVTFGQLKAKAVIKDVARVFSLPFSESNMISSLIPEDPKMTLEKAFEMEPKLSELVESDPKIKQIMTVSRRLEGLLRHASVHAAGVIITDKPLVEYCPLMKGKEGEQVVQFDKNFSEQIGLVKFDFLGLKTLTVIEAAVQFVKAAHDKEFDIEAIDLNDQAVYEFISKGETIGVFQLESSGMIDLCKRLMPNSLEDVTAINALYRPGPLESGMVDDFIDIKHGRKEVSYLFQELEPILRETYGVIVYQEQVMNIARAIAGYTLGQADMLRRAMGKKKAEEMAKQKDSFLKGAILRGFDEKKSGELFDLMALFAEYGFNKSHAVAYALIAYQTAFLKFYYPAAFYAALLSTELSDKVKVTQYIGNAKELGLAVLPPDVNESLWLFNVVDANIRFGLGAIKNVGESAVNELIRERRENGNFKGIIDFCSRVNLRQLNKRMVESLIKVGAFDSCEKYNRKTLLDNLEGIMAFSQKRQEEKELGQTSLFEVGISMSEVADEFTIIKSDDFTDKEKLECEAELMGIYVSGHPLDAVSDLMKQMTSTTTLRIGEMKGTGKREVTMAGIIVERKVILTKKGDKMAFLTLEDLDGKIECIVFPKTWAQYEALLSTNDPILLHGETNLEESPRKFFPSNVQPLKEEADERTVEVRITIPIQSDTSGKLKKFKQILLSHRGSVPTVLIFEDSFAKAKMPLDDEFCVSPSPSLLAEINDLFNSNCARCIIAKS